MPEGSAGAHLPGRWCAQMHALMLKGPARQPLPRMVCSVDTSCTQILDKIGTPRPLFRDDPTLCKPGGKPITQSSAHPSTRTLLLPAVPRQSQVCDHGGNVYIRQHPRLLSGGGFVHHAPLYWQLGKEPLHQTVILAESWCGSAGATPACPTVAIRPQTPPPT